MMGMRIKNRDDNNLHNVSIVFQLPSGILDSSPGHVRLSDPNTS
ncbi:hypothetical protein A359_07930 [secondary endosymbiont of Ctenarytaina eucalypti]|uniref:Uncharacterized protein n=1 Tax=secondary endosymbiont of Ctenarytaina eucalypti TaxID=1199245 RepID=J3TFT4_9ENTR|nr:hypothetical protein A359_07930 [secondary endosymbiont of Ctenarytaina eucalypti]